MIYSTDVQSTFYKFDGVSEAKLLVASGSRLKSVNLVPSGTGDRNSFVEFYDLDDDTSLDATKKLLSLFSGKRAADPVVTGGVWITIPGNGIRFETGIVANATTSDIGSDLTYSVTIIYQGPEPE